MTRLGTSSRLLILGILLAASSAQGQAVDPAPPAETPAPAPAEATAAPPPQAPAAPDYLERGIARFQEGAYEEALEDLTKARISDPASAQAAFYLGATLSRMQNYAKAVPPLRESTTLQPAMREGFLALADAYYALHRDDEALHAVEVAERDGIEPAQTAFLKGLLLVRKRKYDDAVAAFERAKAADPRLASAADFEIATAHHRRGKQAQARELFAAVAQRDPDSAAGQMAGQQAEALAKRLEPAKRFSAVAALQYQFDSNVMLKPDDQAAAANITNESDAAVVATARLEYAVPVAHPAGLKLQYAFYQSAYQDLSQYDVQSHTLGATPSYTLGADRSLALLLSWNNTSVDGGAYLRAFQLSPLFILSPAEDQQLHLTARYQQKDFQRPPALPDEDRDATEVAVGASWYRLFAQQKGFVNVKYELNREDTKGANWSFLGNRAGAALFYPATDLLKFALAAEVLVQSFENTNSSFNAKRTDTTTTFTAQALYGLTRRIDATLQLTRIQDDSSIAVYAFTKNIVSLGLYARF